MINKLFSFKYQVFNLKNNKKHVCYSEEIWSKTLQRTKLTGNLFNHHGFDIY